MSPVIPKHHNVLVWSLIKGVAVGLLVSVFVGSLVAIGHFMYTADAWRLWKDDRLTMAMLYFARGNYYFGGGAYDLDKAYASFVRARDFENIHDARISYQIGRVYFIVGDLEQAIVEFNRQIEEAPDFDKSYYMRGLTYGYQDRFAEAEADFLKFLEFKPESWAGHNDLVWVYFREGKYDKAEEYARKGLVAAPANPWLQNALGASLLNQSKYAEAEQLLMDAIYGFTTLGAEGWGLAYPGNDPRIYEEGYKATLASAEENLRKVQEKLRSE